MEDSTIAVTVFKTFASGEVLTASDLNASFAKIVDNGEDLGWPATKAKDLNGFELILDADGDTGIVSDVDDRIDFKMAGTDSIFFGHGTGNTGAFAHFDYVAFTATANTDIGRVRIGNTNALTVPAGTTAVAATLYLEEPNLTATGTITAAATLYIDGAPTEGGTDNDAILVNSGTINFNGQEILLDADRDTSITADTDDTIDIKVAGSDDFQITPNLFDVLAGSVLKTTGQLELTKGADVESVSDLLVDIDGNIFDVTGTTTIDTFKTRGVGSIIILHFDDALTLMHDATNLILPGGSDIITAAGDEALFYEYATADWRLIIFTPASAGGALQGKHEIPIPVNAMRPTVSNGCAPITDVETTADRPDLQVLDFSTAADEHAQFGFRAPKSWNEGTVTFAAQYTHAGGQTGGLDGVAWFLQGLAVSDDESADQAYGTAVVVTADNATAEDVHQTSESGAITLAGTPAEGDYVFFRVGRDVSDGADDLDIDARLIGITLFWTTNAGNDA